MSLFNKLPRLRLWMLLGACLTFSSGITAQEQEQSPEPEADSPNPANTEEGDSDALQDEEEELRQFTPSEQIRADSEVRFPADI